jgi:hypothetical protein
MIEGYLGSEATSEVLEARCTKTRASQARVTRSDSHWVERRVRQHDVTMEPRVLQSVRSDAAHWVEQETVRALGSRRQERSASCSTSRAHSPDEQGTEVEPTGGALEWNCYIF